MFTREIGWFLCPFLAINSTAGGQDTHTSIAMAAGSGTDVAGSSSSALSISPAVVVNEPSSTFSFTGNGTRFTNRAWSASLGAGFSGRGGTSSVAPTLDASAGGALTSYSFSYATGDATPAVEARFGQARIFGGAHLSSASVSGRLQSPPVTPFGGSSPLASNGGTTRTGAAIVGGGAVTFVATEGESTTLTYRAEHGIVAGAQQTDQLFSIAISNESVGVSGSLGHRMTPGLAVTFGSGMVAIGVTPSIALQVAAGSYPANPMLATPGGQFVNAGLTFRFGNSPPPLPRPSAVAPPEHGMTRLSILARDATAVEVAGEFNHWEFIPTEHAANGVWYVDLRIPAGQYRYAFRVNGTEWRIPAGVSAADDDEFGGKSAWLIVAPTTDRQAKQP